MSTEEKAVFAQVFGTFQEKYPRRRLVIEQKYYGDIVCCDGEERFNLEGYNLLYNLKRLCDCLEDELR